MHTASEEKQRGGGSAQFLFEIWPWLSVLLPFLVCLLSIFFTPGVTFAQEETGEPAASVKLIVKLKASNDNYPGVYLTQDTPLSPITGAPSIDSFNRVFSLGEARPLFRKTFVKDLRESQNVFLQEMEAVRKRFPKRSQRAPEDAKFPDVGNVYVFDLPIPTDPSAAIKELSANPFVESAELPQKVELQTNDPYWSSSGSWGFSYDDLWGLKKIQADQAWTITRGGGVIIAIVDSGIDYNNPDMDISATGNYWINESERMSRQDAVVATIARQTQLLESRYLFFFQEHHTRYG